jgi:hypothetical protein
LGFETVADAVVEQLNATAFSQPLTEVANEPVYAMEHLEEFRQFTSVLTLTFKVWR